jgi:2-polyprenyl-3-methyl-5-hydroxy-6-metoxy-1,4-benzoquinol methylase
MDKCIACCSSDLTQNFISQSVNYNRCNSCGLLFQPIGGQMEKIVLDYKKKYRPDIGIIKKIIFMFPLSIQYIPLFKFLKDIIPNKGKMLDIGSSCGKFMYLMKKKGWTVQGIEPTTHYAEFANKYLKVNTLNLYIEDYETEEKFDFINCSAVLEHLRNPDQVLLKVRTLLKEDGFIFIGVPLDTPKQAAKTHFFFI